ncbi:MAG TPA: hypothetical protein PLO41_05285, partial [Rubrivivax sp.]|nr:hypothetical protein [Rubrivivax sp.]
SVAACPGPALPRRLFTRTERTSEIPLCAGCRQSLRCHVGEALGFDAGRGVPCRSSSMLRRDGKMAAGNLAAASVSQPGPDFSTTDPP